MKTVLFLKNRKTNQTKKKSKKKKLLFWLELFQAVQAEFFKRVAKVRNTPLKMSQQCVWAALYKWIDQLFGKPKLQNESNPVNKAANEENAALYDREDRNDEDNAV